jgi:protease-4
MKRYPQIISKLFYEPLLVTHSQHAAMVRVLDARLAGGGEVGDGRWQIANGKGRRRVSDDNPDLDGQDLPIEENKPDWETYGTDAVIPVHGVLVGHASDIPMSACGCGLDVVADMMDIAVRDSEVTRLLFDFRTPGGGVVGTPELGRKIASCPKQTIGFTDSQCCSGGLWLATQCQEFYATESAVVGSIGVWCAYLDISRQLATEGANIQEISAGKYKTMGAYWKPLSPEEKAMIQRDVDKIYTQFKEAVGLRRVVADEVMQGQIFDGAEAVQNGLCDGLVEGLHELLSGE